MLFNTARFFVYLAIVLVLFYALPRRFRNHCSYDSYSGRSYCSDHCGFDYQFYYCSPLSYGCCHLGFGYCDWSGLLRCHP